MMAVSMTDQEGQFLNVVLDHGLKQADREALRCNETKLDWASLRQAVLATAGPVSAALQGGSGRVAFLGTASVELVVAYLAIIAAGGCAVPLPVSAHPDALAAMITDCEPDLIFVHAENTHLLDPAISIKTIVIEPGAGLPENFLQTAAPLKQALNVDPESSFNIIYSSGTTGRAKGIIHSHAMRYRQAARSLFGLGEDSCMLLATPLYSNTTLMPLLATLFHGGRVILMAKFDADTYLQLGQDEHVTHTMLVPVQYQRILASEKFDSYDLSSFLMKQCTGAPLTSAIKQAVAQKWPGQFFEIYGLTEGGCTCILDITANPDKAHTVGKPATGNDIRIVDEDGRSVPAGTRGEIIGRSGTMMSGYFRNDEANAAFYMTDADGVQFHRTGDIGMFDEDGFLILLDRKKDLIISGGFNIYAVDLEEKLLSHPDVADAAVIAVPSERWGETPLGLVVAKSDTNIDPAELLDWVNAQLGRTQRLSAVELRDMLPRSNVGKVLKQELRQPYWANAVGKS